MSDGWRVAVTKEDRANEQKVRALMIRRGMPASSITISAVIRFAMKLASEAK